MKVKPHHHGVIWEKHSFFLSQYPNQNPPSWQYFCLPPPAPALVPNEQAHRPGSVGGTSSRATSDAEMRHSFPCSSQGQHNAWWNEGEQPSPGLMLLMSVLFPRHEQCPSSARAVPEQCIIFCTGQLHSLLSHLTCTPLALHRKSNVFSIWQRVWQSFPDSYYWCIPPSARIPFIIVVISVC